MAIRVQWEWVSPKRAREFLDASVGNRNISEAKVLQYSEDMSRNRWQVTHQGFLVGKGGAFIDGHHRCHAIIRSGATVRVMVTYNSEIESPQHAPIDIGLNRSAAYVLGVSSGLSAAAGLLARIVSAKKVSLLGLEPYVRWIRPPYETLMEKGTATVASIFSSSPIRLACCVLMKDKPSDTPYICEVYRGLVLGNIHDLPVIASKFYVSATKSRMDQRELLARSLNVFNPAKRSNTFTLIRNWETRHAETVDYVTRVYRGK